MATVRADGKRSSDRTLERECTEKQMGWVERGREREREREREKERKRRVKDPPIWVKWSEESLSYMGSELGTQALASIVK